MIKALMPALFIISLASGEIFNGMTLFSVIDNNGSGDTYYTLLIDNEKNEIKRWTHPRGVASMHTYYQTVLSYIHIVYKTLP